jgi:hypothetical protein
VEIEAVEVAAAVVEVEVIEEAMVEGIEEVAELVIEEVEEVVVEGIEVEVAAQANRGLGPSQLSAGRSLE